MIGANVSLYNSTPATAFSLTDISGLTAWYKYNEGVTSSSSVVSLWNDSSGNNRHMGNITATNKRPVVNGSDSTIGFATDRYLELGSSYGTNTDFPNSNEFTAFLAVRIPYNTATTKVNPIVVGETTLDSFTVGNLAFIPGDNSYYAFNGNGSDQNFSLADSSEQTHVHVNNQLFVFAIRRTGTSLTFMRNSRSNVIITSTESNTTATVDLNTLGTKAAGGSNVSIAEIAIYNSSLSDSDFDTVIDDIKTRVGI